MLSSLTKLLILTVALVAVASITPVTVAQTPRKSQSNIKRAPRIIVIRNVTVIAATGAPPITNSTVVIRDENIAAIGPAGETAVPSGARVIEGNGKFLVPGFIEVDSSSANYGTRWPVAIFERCTRPGWTCW